MNNLEIRVTAMGSREELQYADAVCSFIGKVIEQVLTQEVHMDSTAISPLTGEPIYLTASSDAVGHLNRVTVSSPSAIYNALGQALDVMIAESLLEQEQYPASTITFVDGKGEEDWTP